MQFIYLVGRNCEHVKAPIDAYLGHYCTCIGGLPSTCNFLTDVFMYLCMYMYASISNSKSAYVSFFVTLILDTITFNNNSGYAVLSTF